MCVIVMYGGQEEAEKCVTSMYVCIGLVEAAVNLCDNNGEFNDCPQCTSHHACLP